MKNEPLAENIRVWTDRNVLYAALLLLGGFIFPLFKPSMIFQTSVFIWPWNTIGLVNNEITRAAMATNSAGQHMVLWTLLPLLAGVIALIIRPVRSFPIRFIGIFGTGVVSFLLLIAVLIKEAEILGIVFLPPTIGGGIIISLAVLSGALIATSNRIRKWFGTGIFSKILSATGGVLLALFIIMTLLASPAEWRSWSMILLYLFIFGYAVMGVISAFYRTANRLFLEKISWISRISLIWLPFAVLVAQGSSNNPVVSYVIGGGGGTVNIFMSVVKAVFIYYGSVFLMTTGLIESLARLMVREGD